MIWRKMFEVPEIKNDSQTHSQGLGFQARLGFQSKYEGHKNKVEG